MTDYDSVDFFADESLLEDPYPYFDHLRSPVPRPARRSTTGSWPCPGYEEASEIYLNTETSPRVTRWSGPFATFPVPLEGDDVSEIIETYRDQLPMNEHMVTMDPPDHTQERALIMRLLTPKRLKENEAFMWRLADRQIDEFVADGHCEFIKRLHPALRHAGRGRRPRRSRVGSPALPRGFRLRARARASWAAGARACPRNALSWLDDWFTTYIEDRRAQPRVTTS